LADERCRARLSGTTRTTLLGGGRSDESRLWRGRMSPRFEVSNRDGREPLAEREAQHLRVERQLRLIAGTDVVGVAEPVTFAGEGQQHVRDAARLQGRRQGGRLRRRDDAVLLSLKQDYRGDEALQVMNG